MYFWNRIQNLSVITSNVLEVPEKVQQLLIWQTSETCICEKERNYKCLIIPLIQSRFLMCNSFIILYKTFLANI